MDESPEEFQAWLKSVEWNIAYNRYYLAATRPGGAPPEELARLQVAAEAALKESLAAEAALKEAVNG
jgi:hypothetical protein